MLSVLASAAAAARGAGSDRLDEVAVAAAEAAAGALPATTGQLPELARAGVVDAGGLGVWLVLDALAGLVSGRAGEAVPLPGTRPAAAAADRRPGQPAPRVRVRGHVPARRRRGPPASTRCAARWTRLGDSVAVAGDGTGTWTVHVHTADVGAVLEAGSRPGGRVGSPSRRSPTQPCGHGSHPRRHGPVRPPARRAAGRPRRRSWPSWPAPPGRRCWSAEPDRAVGGRRRWSPRWRGTRARQVVLLPGDRELDRRRRAGRRAGPARRPGGPGDPHRLGAAGAGRARRARSDRAGPPTTWWPWPRRPPAPAPPR